MALCGYLTAAGAAVVVSDLDANRCAQAAVTYGATVAAPEEIHAQHVDVFAPAALGAVLNDATIPCLRCRVVCGGANNQLAEARHDAVLAVRGSETALPAGAPGDGPRPGPADQGAGRAGTVCSQPAL